MSLDAINLRFITNELSKELFSGRIDRIYQTEKDMLVFFVRIKTDVKKLVISINSRNPRIHISNENFKSPDFPPMFCMLLRKHIDGARIISVKELDFDRVCDISFECVSETGTLTVKHILVELMGRNSNIIFTDSDYKIIDSIRKTDEEKTDHIVLPDFIYEVQKDFRINPFSAEESEVKDALLSVFGNVEKGILEKISGISPILIREALYRVKGFVPKIADELSKEEKEECAKIICSFFKEEKPFPCIVYKSNGEAIDFCAFKITQYGRCEEKASMSEAMEEFYSKRDNSERMKNHALFMTKSIHTALERAKRKADIYENTQKEAQNREKYRHEGDLIVANMYRIKKGDKEVSLTDYETGNDVLITLDENLTPNQNAQKKYKLYNKAKSSVIYAKERLEITLSEIEYLNSVLLFLENAKNLSELSQIRDELLNSGYIKENKKQKKKKTESTKILEYDVQGYRVLVGRNNTQNDYVTLKLGRANDLWLHTKHIAGSHVVIKNNGIEFPSEVIKISAEIASYFSQGKNSDKVEVDYCPIKNVKKPPKAKAGMVTYEIYSTALVSPNEHSDLVKKS